MTITNFRAVATQAGNVNISFDKTLTYVWIYQDNKLLVSGQDTTSWSGPRVDGATYQAVDSATQSPIPSPLEKVPIKYLAITWQEEATAVQYEVIVNSAVAKTFTRNGGPYTYETERLPAGVATIAVRGVDDAGNKLPSNSELSYLIKDVPPPVRSIVLTDGSTLGTDITVTLQEPVGWPT